MSKTRNSNQAVRASSLLNGERVAGPTRLDLASIDLERLADRVYRLLQAELRLEQARGVSRRHRQ